MLHNSTFNLQSFALKDIDTGASPMDFELLESALYKSICQKARFPDSSGNCFRAYRGVWFPESKRMRWLW